MKNSASVQWHGSLKAGSGEISTESRVLDHVKYGFSTRFEGSRGINPEELIAAAHASCFSMAVSAELGKNNIEAKLIDTKATVTLEKQGDGFSVTESHLETDITAPGADEAKIQSAAASAKENCPISKLLNTKISLSLKIAGVAK